MQKAGIKCLSERESYEKQQGVCTLDKKKYYIAVGSGQILEDKEISSFELEIEATEDEVNQLQELFQLENMEEAPIFLAPHSAKDILNIGAAAWEPYKETEVHEEYDHHLAAIYRLLHQLGTPETKKHIESMNIL